MICILLKRFTSTTSITFLRFIITSQLESMTLALVFTYHQLQSD
ncbi:hypothetical protein STRUR_2150 [Streptococcus urinalis 2285-97]|uniref:Uncharacterized protein n=1 Tax=Streptococcus urinalis 2285-97 TaxID=764291 RepID=G5KEU2_9STRE|nr:hypothetical protein STRUR_2150 [Streptococcus urinalis 2285-97]